MKLFHISHKVREMNPWKQGVFFWYRHYKFLFSLWFLIVLICGGYVWCSYLYRYQWDDATKKAYGESHFKETAFKEDVFNQTVDHMEKRATEHSVTPDFSRNIFLEVQPPDNSGNVH